MILHLSVGMQNTQPLNRNIQQLIRANYERMIAFEQAAFLSKEEMLKSFYGARADESGAYIQELHVCLHLPFSEGKNFHFDSRGKTGFRIADIFNGRRTAIKILEAAKLLEKTILGWYNAAIHEINSLPAELNSILTSQYRALCQSKSQLENL
jgi:hypothetical protein